MRLFGGGSGLVIQSCKGLRAWVGGVGVRGADFGGGNFGE